MPGDVTVKFNFVTNGKEVAAAATNATDAIRQAIDRVVARQKAVAAANEKVRKSYTTLSTSATGFAAKITKVQKQMAAVAAQSYKSARATSAINKELEKVRARAEAIRLLGKYLGETDTRASRLRTRFLRIGQAIKQTGVTATKGLARLPKVFQSAARQASALNARLANTNKAIKRTVKSASLLKKAFRLGLAAAGIFSLNYAIRRLARTLGNMIKVGAEFEHAMAEVAAILGDVAAVGSKTFEKLEDAALRLGRTTVFTARQVAKAQVAMARSGLQVEEILGTLQSTIDLAAVGNLQMAEAAGIAVAAIRALGQSSKEFTKTVNVMTFAAVKSNQTVGDFGQAMRFAAPAAAVAKVSIEDLAFSFSLMANAGIRGQKAGAAVRKTFATLFAELNKQGKFSGKLAGLGKELFELKDGEETFIGLADALDLMLRKGFTATKAFDVFGVRAGNFFALLAKQGPESIRLFHQELEKAGNIAERIREQKMQTLTGDVILLKSAWEGVSQTLTRAASPSLRALTSGLTELLKKVAESEAFSNAIERIFEGIVKLVQDFGKAFTDVAPILVNMFSNLHNLLAGASVAVYRFSAAAVEAFGEAVTAGLVPFIFQASKLASTLNIGGVDKALAALAATVQGSFSVAAAVLRAKAQEAADSLKDNEGAASDAIAAILALAAELEDLTRQQENFKRENIAVTAELKSLAAQQDKSAELWANLRKKMEEVGLSQDDLAAGVSFMQSKFQKMGVTILPLLDDFQSKYLSALLTAKEFGKIDLVKASTAGTLRTIVDQLTAAGIAVSEFQYLIEQLSDAEDAEIDLRVNPKSLDQLRLQTDKTLAGLGLSDSLLNVEKSKEQLKEVAIVFDQVQQQIAAGAEVPPLKLLQFKESLKEIVRDIKETLGPKAFQELLGKLPVKLSAEITDVEVPEDVFAEIRAKLKASGAGIDIGEAVTFEGVGKSIGAITEKLKAIEDIRPQLPTAAFNELRDSAIADISKIWEFLDAQQQQYFIEIVPNLKADLFSRQKAEFITKNAAMENELIDAQIAALDRYAENFQGNRKRRLQIVDEANALELEKFQNAADARLLTETNSVQELAALAAFLNKKKTDLEEAQTEARAKLAKDLRDQQVQMALGAAAGLAGALDGLFGNTKAFAIAEAIINTAQAVTKALSQGGAILGPAMAAMVAATGAAQIAKIKKTKPQKQIMGGIQMGPDFGVDSQVAIRRPGEATIPKSMTDLLLTAGREFVKPAGATTENSPDAARRGGGAGGDIPDLNLNLTIQALDSRDVKAFFEDNSDYIADAWRLAAARGSF